MKSYQKETSRVRRFLLNWPERILAKGRPRTYIHQKVKDEELDQISRMTGY